MCYDADHMGLSSYTTPSTVSLTCSIIIQPPPTSFFFFFNDTATTEIYTLSLHDALPICERAEPPHVDQPVYAGHRFETKRRHRIQDGHREAERVHDAERERQGEREQLAPHEQRAAEEQQVLRNGRRRDQVADIALVLVEHAVD